MEERHRPHPRQSDAARDRSASDSPARLPHHLRGLKLRTKIVIPMVALAIVPMMALGLFVMGRTQASLWEAATARVSFDTASKAQAVETFLEDVQHDLLFLSQLSEIHDLAESLAAGSTARVALLRREAEQALLIFCRGKRAYYQVRYLDMTGREIVRLDVEQGRPKIIPVAELQDKSGRYYVTETLKTEPGDIYISPMDLNIERGQIEIPHHPVVRHGTPVVGDGGELLGILVINFDADYVFSLLGPLPPQTEAWLTDEHGLYLGYTGPSEENRRRDALASERRLEADYTAEQASTILRPDGAAGVIETEDVLLSFVPIPLAEAASGRHWTLIIAQSRAPLEAPIRQFSGLLYGVLGLTTALACLVALVIANYLARPVGKLRHTIREITAGHLSERVEIRTGDEIEGLAVDFNTMMERLRQTQSRNIELQQEVGRQAHRLQTGLARADKLASIGQMTAGVMHEIGNPLAAIKTKIQVAEEEGTGCPGCRSLSTEVLAEVDRLSVFLRSFSRLARLPETTFEAVSVTDIVQSVHTLVAQELQRRGVTLHIASPTTTPMIRGDADQLRQLLINLILNAAEALPKSGQIRIKVEHLPQDLGARIEIADDGSGISKEHLRRIWDPFFTTKAEGTGLGLAICRQIVEAHEGTITVGSEDGAGTVVNMTFPAVDSGPAGLSREDQ